jgi:diacylglycerol kinase family enzyme
LQRGLGRRAEFQPTEEAGHAEELALRAAQAGFAVVGAAGGDGTVHEVANGILRAGRPEVALAVFPIGSANDYAHSLGLDADWWQTPGHGTRAVDVGWVRSSHGRERYFVNGLGLGFNGAVTFESRRIRRLQGVPLYSVALLRALWYHFKAPEVHISMDGESRTAPTLALSIALGRREGNFVLAPHAVLDDGLFDFLHAGLLRRWELVRFFPRMVTGRLPTHPQIRYGRCREVSLSSLAPLTTHLDGELFSLPQDEVHGLEVRLLPGALSVRGRWNTAGVR